LIGKNGKNLNEIRAKFNDVQIQIPSVADKSDVVTIRGAKSDVEACFKHLQQFVRDIQESNYQEELQIVKEFHKIVIGKQGAFIKKIRDETQTRIDIPAEESNSNTILITGKQDQVRKAKRQIEEKIKELVNIKEDYVDIPHQLHTALIGKNGNEKLKKKRRKIQTKTN
jgi:type II secretory pathway component GspD/PulD (secretin)